MTAPTAVPTTPITRPCIMKMPITRLDEVPIVFRMAISRLFCLTSRMSDEMMFNAPTNTIKPMVSALFPITFGEGTLFCSEELVDGSLVCAGDGPTAYEMARDELAHYFGIAFVDELDLLAQSVASSV